MGQINIREVVEGMTLEKDVKDHNGRLLASKGTKLTSKSIRIFKIWGIGNVWINEADGGGEPVEGPARPPESLRRKAEEMTGFKFQYNDLSRPFVEELYRISAHKKALQWHQNPGLTESSDQLENQEMEEPKRIRKLSKKINPDYLIRKTLRMETIPDIYFKTIEAINNPEASLDDISQIVSKDITLSAKVLQLVNSSFYSLRQKVDTLTWALALIGTNQLMTVVSGVSAVSLFKNIPSKIMNMASFWEHSIACGATARLLASYLGIGMDGERFFVAGLLHDIGRMILIQNLPNHYIDLFKKARTEKIFLCSAETEKFGMDHSRIGAEMALHWNLPDGLVNMIRFHHLPGKEKSFRETSIINLADIIVNALEIGNSGEFFVPVIEPRVCEALDLKKEILQPVINQLENQLEDVFQIIYGKSEEIIDSGTASTT